MQSLNCGLCTIIKNCTKIEVDCTKIDESCTKIGGFAQKSPILEIVIFLWHKTTVPIFIERFLLAVFAGVLLSVVFFNVMGMDVIQRTTLGIAVVFFAGFVAQTLHKYNETEKISKLQNSKSVESALPASTTNIAETTPPAPTAIEVKPQPSELQSSKSDGISSPVQMNSEPAQSAPLEAATHIGIAGTGVTANVSMSTVSTFDKGRMLFFSIENTSQVGTITNIGFILKTQDTPTEIEKVESDGVLGPGNYRLTQKRWEIKTLGFNAISAFGLATYNLFEAPTDESFYSGLVTRGIPPGKSTRFGLIGLSKFSMDELKKAMILRFQAIGEDNKADIAMFHKLDILFPTITESSIYEIQRTNESK